METQDNGFLLVIDGVRKEKERLTAANPLIWVSRMVRLAEMTSHDYKHKKVLEVKAADGQWTANKNKNDKNTN